MKRFSICIILVYIILFNINAEPSPRQPPPQTVHSKKESIQENTFDTLRENALSITIQSQEKTISQMALFFSGLAIIVGIASIIAPFLAYILAIRPAQKITREIGNVKDNMNAIIDKKFEEYIQDYEFRRIDSYINNLETGPDDKKQAARLYLGLNQHLITSEKHILRIYTILSGQIDIETRNSLSYILTTKDSILSRHYFERCLRERLGQNYGWYAFSFFLNFGIEKSTETIFKFFDTLTDVEFTAFIYQIGSLFASKDNASKEQLYNNRRIIDSLTPEKLAIIYKHAKDTVYKLNLENFQSTYLAQKISS